MENEGTGRGLNRCSVESEKQKITKKKFEGMVGLCEVHLDLLNDPYRS